MTDTVIDRMVATMEANLRNDAEAQEALCNLFEKRLVARAKRLRDFIKAGDELFPGSGEWFIFSRVVKLEVCEMEKDLREATGDIEELEKALAELTKPTTTQENK